MKLNKGDYISVRTFYNTLITGTVFFSGRFHTLINEDGTGLIRSIPNKLIFVIRILGGKNGETV